MDAGTSTAVLRHDAFISYSRKDREFAKALERALEDYKPPRDLQVPQRRLVVFRDEDDFTGAEYHRSLDRSLSESSALIVICSPSARQSSYVDDEIRRFAARRGEDRIISILLSGLPNNEVQPGREDQAAFPPGLCELLAMPLAISYRNFDIHRDRVYRGAFQDSWFTLLANIYGIRRDELEQREKRRQAKNRRIVAIGALTIITVLSTALVFALLSRQEAVRQRSIAEDRRVEAEEQRDLATKAAEAERLAAIEARRETSGRLAVQAQEALSSAPEKSLSLAMRAVETFHRAGDPTVPEAIGALQQAVLSMLGSRPLVPWAWRNNALAWSSDQSWVVVADEKGTLHAGPAGNDAKTVLNFPGRIRAASPRWGTSIKLAFGPRGLLALRDYRDRSGSEKVAAVFWPFNKGSLIDSPRVLDSFDSEGSNSTPIRFNRDGAWVSWSDGYRTTFLRQLSATSALPIACEVSDCVSAFADDGESFWFAGPVGIRRYRLDPALAGPAQKPVYTLETRLGRIQKIAVSPRGDRVALLSENGEVEWWDLSSSAAPMRHEAPRVFTAYADQLAIYNLESDAARRTLEFDRSGNALLSTFVEAKSGDFGIAAVLVLQSDRGWVPLLHRHRARFLESVGRTSGEVGGAVSGYEVKKGDELGVAFGIWAAPGGVVTVGQDGSVLFWRVDRGASMVLPTPLSTIARLAGTWLVTGGRDGKVAIWDMNSDEREPMRILNGHDAPIRDLDIAPDRRRIISVDETGARRVWALDHPSLGPGQVQDVTADWRWLVSQTSSSELRFWDGENLNSLDPVASPALDDVRSAGFDREASRAVTLHWNSRSPASVTMRLWDTESRLDKPLIERRWKLTGLDGLWGWSTRSDLRVTAKGAMVVFSGGSGIRRQYWLGDLQKDSPPVPLLRRNERALDVLPDLSWLITEESASGAQTPAYFARELTGTESRRVRIRGLRNSPYLADASPDGRWALFSMSLRQGLLDVSRLREETGVSNVVDVGEARDVVLGKDRPPLWIDPEGRLRGVFSASQANAITPIAIPGVTLTGVRWAKRGEFLVLADAARVWVVDRPDTSRAEKLAEQIGRGLQSGLLPMPAADAGAGSVERVFAFGGPDRIVAATEAKSLLIWQRNASGTWQAPVLHRMDTLRLDRVSEAAFSEDGKHARFGSSEGTAALSFDADTLLRLARNLRSDRPESK